jgi:hypothetical protein
VTSCCGQRAYHDGALAEKFDVHLKQIKVYALKNAVFLSKYGIMCHLFGAGNFCSSGKNMKLKWRGVVYKNGIDAGDTLGRHTFYRMLLVSRELQQASGRGFQTAGNVPQDLERTARCVFFRPPVCHRARTGWSRRVVLLQQKTG